MANIEKELNDILSAKYGKDVRGSIHNAIKLINDVSEVVISAGSKITSTDSSTEGFYDKSLYFNNVTNDLWKCDEETNSWVLLTNLKGETGNGIESVLKTDEEGLIDIYTITYTDGETDEFRVRNGEKGLDANIFVRYSKYSDGTDFHEKPNVDDEYVGYYTGVKTEAPDDKSEYDWMFVGFDPIQTEVMIDFDTGELLYSGGNLAFAINENGELEWGED